MDPIAVTAALLRNQLPDVPIREGASMMARVASRGESHAVLVIAGIPVTAELPRDIPAGSTLKLKVKEVSADRVWLQIDPQGPTAAPTPVVAQADAPLPARPHVAVEEEPGRRRGADGELADIVSLSFNSPTLGRLDLRLEFGGERLLAEVPTPPGPPYRAAANSAERLRATLEAVGLEATVKVRPRSA